MTPRPPKQQPAVLVELSQFCQAVIYGRGSVVLIRNGVVTHLNDLEAGKLALSRDAFAAARNGEPEPAA